MIPPRPQVHRTPWLIWALAGFAFVATVIIALSIRREFADQQRQQAVLRQDEKTRQTAAALSQHLDHFASLLRGGYLICALRPDASQADWDQYAAALCEERDVTGLRAFGFLAAPAPGSARTQPVVTLSYTFPQALTPEDYALFQSAAAQAALNESTSGTALAVATALTNEPGQPLGEYWLIVQPVFTRGPAWDDPAATASRHTGWVFAVVSFRDVFQAHSLLPPTVHVQIHRDRSLGSDTVVYDNQFPDAVTSDDRPPLASLSPMQCLGHRWFLLVRGQPGWFSRATSPVPGLIVSAGLLLGALLSTVIVLLGTTRHRALRLADQMTSDLREARDLLEDRVAERTREIEASHAGLAAEVRRRMESQAAQQRLAAIVEATPDLVGSFTVTGVPTFLNAAFRRLCGVPADADLSRMTFVEFLPPAAAEQFRTQALPAALAGEIWIGETSLLGADGRELPVSQVLIPHRDESGAVLQLSSILRDVSRLKRSERDLLLTQERFELAVLATRDGVWDWVIGSEHAYYSARWKEMLGFADNELENKFQTWVSLVHPDDRARVLEAEEAFIAGQSPTYEEEYRLQHKDGSYRWVLARGFLMRDAAGRPVRLVGSDSDITERKAAESLLQRNVDELEKRVEERTRELSIARDAAEESARLKSQFLANMSHEIRTPMNGIIGMIGLLLDTPLSAEQRDYAHTIRSSSDALLTIINDVLDLSKMEAGKMNMERIEFDPRALVDGTIELMAEPAAAKLLDVGYLVEPDVPTTVIGDPGRIRQVILNLVNNAIKFTKVGGVVLRVELHESGPDLDVLRFVVSDTGIGMSDELLGRLFLPFTQADGSTTRRFGGSGLGLAISKQLVELMGGEIGARGSLGVGSTFWFTVPFEHSTKSSRPVAPERALAGIRVLIIEDDTGKRAILEQKFAFLGATVVSCATTSDARRILSLRRESADPFRVVIASVDMQRPTLLDEAQALATDPECADTPLVLVTAGGQALLDECRRLPGIAGVLQKPVRTAQLRQLLVRLLDLPNDTEPRTTPVRPAPHQGARPSGAHVLVVEDNEVNRRVAMSQLERLGHHADAVPNGLEALITLRRRSYDLVLMDGQMPEMDGYEATRHIRADETDRKHTVIVAMTANALAGDREKCLASGMDDYISKPVRLGDLERVLQRWLPQHATTAPAGGATVADSAEPVDLRHLREIAGDERETMEQIITLYREQTLPQVKELAERVARRDPQGVGRLAHTMRGASAACGARALADLLSGLETSALADDWNEAETLARRVPDEFARTCQHLRRALGTE